MPKIRTYGLDVDTLSYAKRVRDGSGREIGQKHLIDINRFVIGIKRMGLWDKMVCWPMRSIHNAGTGSTVYSLGGLGVYNGTMVNSPVWRFTGILFDKSISQWLSLPVPSASSGSQLINFRATQSALSVEGPYDRGNGHHYIRISGMSYVYGIWNSSSVTPWINTGVSSSDLNRNRIGTTYGPPDGMSLYVNGKLAGINPSTVIGSNSTPIIKIGNAQFFWTGEVSFFMHSIDKMTLEENNQIFDMQNITKNY